MSGTLIDGRYRLQAEVRRDADLVTYDAVDERLGRPVTLRLVKAERSGDPAYLERYRAAVARAAALSHPHVVPVYDSNLAGQQPFVVEGHVDGPSLADLLASGERLAPRAVIRLAQQAAAALAAAHGGGVVHGTLSPECLLLDEQGDLRIADFTRPPLGNPPVAVVRYQAPEQVLGNPADPRSDVFALAAVLYHLIDGQPPFDGADAAAVNLAKISSRPRPLESVAPDLPRPLLRAIEQSLATNPADRPAHGGAFRELLDLAAVAASGLPSTPSAPPPGLDTTQVLQPTQVLPVRDLAAAGYGGTPEPDPSPRRPRPLPTPAPEPSGGMLPWLSLLVVVAVVVGLYFALRNPNARPADQPLVPALINKTEGDALTEARAAGLQVQVAGRKNSDTVPGGQVLEQVPAAGEPLPEDKVIQLVLSLGPRFVTVPTVVGMTEGEAKKTLPKYGLRVAVQLSEDPSQPDGTVIAQAPQAGQKADKGGLVRIQVNKLPKETVVPPDSSAEETPPEGSTAEGGGPVDAVVDGAVDEAKKRAGEAIEEIGDKAKERAKEEIDKIKERGREKVREARDELVKGVKDRLSGGGGEAPEKGR